MDSMYSFATRLSPSCCFLIISASDRPFFTYLSLIRKTKSNGTCCDMGQNDTIGKIELKPSIVLSSDNTNCKNDIQLFPQLFDELSVYRDFH